MRTVCIQWGKVKVTGLNVNFKSYHCLSSTNKIFFPTYRWTRKKSVTGLQFLKCIKLRLLCLNYFWSFQQRHLGHLQFDPNWVSTLAIYRWRHLVNYTCWKFVYSFETLYLLSDNVFLDFYICMLKKCIDIWCLNFVDVKCERNRFQDSCLKG